MVDKLLIAGCKKGSREALRRIYEKYRDDLLILAIALSHDAGLAEDAVHDVFVGFAQNVASFELTGSLRAYLAKCVANRVRDLMRSGRSRAKTLGSEYTRPVEQGRGEPSEFVACNEQLRLLSSALAELPYEQREVIALHIHGQMRFRSIAKSMGISVNTVKGRYRYGIQKLRSILNGEIRK